MKPILLIAAAVTLLAFTGRAFATCETAHDYTTGNDYQICVNTDNQSGDVQEDKSLAGSYWDVTYSQDMAHTGNDSNSSQNDDSDDAGGYYNDGTGMYCAGSGDLPVGYPGLIVWPADGGQVNSIQYYW